MHKIMNILGLFIAGGVWLGAGYFLFFYPESTSKMQIGIIIMLLMMLLLNGLFTIALRFAAGNITKVTTKDYIMTIIFGYFGCTELRRRIISRLKAEIEEKEQAAKEQAAANLTPQKTGNSKP